MWHSGNSTTGGVESTRRFLLESELTPDLTELRQDLLDVADVMEIDFPERERWREEAKHDVEFRQQWFARATKPETREPVGDPVRAEPQTTPRNGKKKKVGRNDPCPCGSGKKYKKCCLGQ
jgi:uncharacterized protein YchJ